MDSPNKITPCLWFNFNAEEAVNFYLSIFRSGKILQISRYGDSVPDRKGAAMMMRFEIAGQEFRALNGGPQYPFTEAISLSVDCATQVEVDELWTLLSDGGSQGRCGWLKDKFGLSWQIVPRSLGKLLGDPDPARAGRAMREMMTMSKLDIDRMERDGTGRERRSGVTFATMMVHVRHRGFYHPQLRFRPSPYSPHDHHDHPSRAGSAGRLPV